MNTKMQSITMPKPIPNNQQYLIYLDTRAHTTISTLTAKLFPNSSESFLRWPYIIYVECSPHQTGPSCNTAQIEGQLSPWRGRSSRDSVKIPCTPFFSFTQPAKPSRLAKLLYLLIFPKQWRHVYGHRRTPSRPFCAFRMWQRTSPFSKSKIKLAKQVKLSVLLGVVFETSSAIWSAPNTVSFVLLTFSLQSCVQSRSWRNLWKSITSV